MYLIVDTEISAQLFSEKSDKSVSLILFAKKTEKTHPFRDLYNHTPFPRAGEGSGVGTVRVYNTFFTPGINLSRYVTIKEITLATLPIIRNLTIPGSTIQSVAF